MNVTLRGMKLNYVDLGSGEPILVLHGWGSNLEVHRAMLEQLARGYRVLALDLPGFGESDEPPCAYGVDDFADVVLEFLQPFGFSSLTLIGHSFGGRIIIKLANRTLPFAVRRIVLIDSAGIRPQPTKKGGARRRRYRFLRAIAGFAPVRRLFPGALEALRKRFGSADYAAASPRMRECLVKTVNEDLTPLLPGVRSETLLIWGENDTATPLSDGQTMEKAMPNAGLAVIPNAGHFCFLEQPVIFSRIIASFFRLE